MNRAEAGGSVVGGSVVGGKCACEGVIGAVGRLVGAAPV